jgi:hypothetical protein
VAHGAPVVPAPPQGDDPIVRKLPLPILLSALLAAAVPSAPVATAAAPSHAPTAALTKKRRCDRNYSGRCLRPNVSDYDCAGGSGNGPYYVSGPFRVVGTDHYRLDSDHDGIACES